MNKKSDLKPNLIDPYLEQKILASLQPEKDNYWEPAKNSLQSIYQKYISPNIIWIIVIFAFLLILVYRYKSIQAKKKMEQQEARRKPKVNDKKSESDITRLLLDYYNSQKELSREPKVKGNVYPTYPN